MFKSFSNQRSLENLGLDDSFEKGMNNKTIEHLDNSFKLNLKRYNEAEKV